MESLAALVRRIDPSWLQNVVMPGRTGMAGSQSVVFPTEAAAAMWGDLRDDARLTSAPSGSGAGDTEDTTPTTYYEEPTTEPETSTTSTSTTRPPLLGGGGDTTTTSTTDPYGY
jgi:hypothetical protein